MPIKKSVEYTLYQFDELSDKAKEKARDWYRESSSQFFDAENFKELSLEEPAAYYHRVKVAECNFSLSNCQGDGVAFYGDFDLDFFMDKPGDEGAPDDGGPLAGMRAPLQEMVRKLREANYTLNVTIERCGPGNYNHYNTMNVKVEADDSDGGPLDKLVEEFQKGLDQYMEHVSRDVEKRGYEELDYQASAECVDENIRANEYTFSVSGARLEV